jgi:signal transduction histidine kinase
MSGEEVTLHNTRNECILIFKGDADLDPSVVNSIRDNVPTATTVIAESLEDYRQKIQSTDFDLIIFDCELEVAELSELITQLKFKEYDPSVLAIGQLDDVRDVMHILSAGCHRFVLRSGNWLEELGPAMRSLLRVRRLVDENRRLHAKLIEANIFLEAKNIRLDEFSATVAHDIRGPLGGICMKLDYLIDTYGEKLEPRAREIMRRALESSNRLTEIVQAMYDFAKIGSRVTNMMELDLSKLIREVLMDMNLDENKDIEIGLVEFPPIWGSADLLRRVFINLFGNAIKYSDKETTIINVGILQYTDRALGKFIDFYIEDNGSGIAADDLRDIFTMFRRGSSEKTREHDGLGVGLSVVQRIVELHYGSISVESEKGKGTRFVISLPLEKIDFIS